jgi:hypothetical protein
MNESKEFYYEVKNDDSSIDIIRHKEDFYGYDPSFPTMFKENMIDLAREIYDDKEIISNFEFSPKGRDLKYVKSSKKIWNELNIDLQKVQYFKDRDYDTSTFDNVITKEFCDKLGYDYPTKLPIIYVDDLLKSTARAMYLEFETHNSILFKDILLPKVNKEINSCIYAHELTHIEQDNVGGGVNKMTNMETLPILIELLFSDKITNDSKVTNTIIRHRMAYLAGAIAELVNDKGMNFERRIKLETYVISIIQGLELYNRYHESKEEIKQDIIDSINKVFTGDKLVEDMLDDYNSNYDKVDLKVKTLKRQYKIQ